MYDVIVIGGGPSGLMASIAAASQGAAVLLIDKGDQLGRKLGISGGGRCNVTNRMALDDLIAHIPGNGRFMHSPFSVFNNEDIIQFFENLGIRLKEEDRGRMFPVSDKASTVVRTLIDRVKDLGVKIKTHSPVKEVRYDEEKVLGVTLENGEVIDAHAVIIATGGKSVPHTGSTGDGYPWATKAGHTITDLYPTEVPITSNEPFIKNKELQGLSLRDVELSVLNAKGKVIKTHEGDMIFTHFGISGPIVLRCSQYVVKELKKQKKQPATVVMSIDLNPGKSGEEIFQELRKLVNKEPKKAVKNVLKGYLPDRMLTFLLEKIEIDLATSCANIGNDPLRSLSQLIKEFRFEANGTLPIEKAFVTGGGVSVKEIHPKTMESKCKNGLYFCGEVLDIHGYTGGYNITAAFSTGYTAGFSAGSRKM
ncbi:NAD(P)/FAD-dependent oxidoreductase [Alkalihalobacterium chitinilyticum]|uniref:NAD(P)/FAD-dependent oxidoreductase n=1 Tax=Alkalihalobacterium chitinilyticum TaxID=2980103 RepID=A0ABT5VJP2_9BACI|nr:NAD(P)/FAD-dependent oxidoreductase [Alkalihalobacterium chitinilyticum]MDE5415669.1 NAD(P)/FAD-dependent oxidoreductase [Alkalihalobacterium chitinilyticum]